MFRGTLVRVRFPSSRAPFIVTQVTVDDRIVVAGPLEADLVERVHFDAPLLQGSKIKLVVAPWPSQGPFDEDDDIGLELESLERSFP